MSELPDQLLVGIRQGDELLIEPLELVSMSYLNLTDLFLIILLLAQEVFL